MTNDNLDKQNRYLTFLIFFPHPNPFQTYITQKCTANRKSLYAVHFCISWGKNSPDKYVLPEC